MKSQTISMLLVRLLLLISVSNFLFCLDANNQSISLSLNRAPFFDILSNVSVWQMNSANDFHYCNEFIADSVDLSFYLIGGGVHFNLSKIGSMDLIQNISSGYVNGTNVQNISFRVGFSDGDSFLFESHGQPSVSPSGTLSFRTAVGAAGYASYDLLLVNHVEDFGSRTLNSSPPKKLLFVISPAYVAIGFLVPSFYNVQSLRNYIAREAAVKVRSLMPSCSECMTSTSSGISFLDGSNCTSKHTRDIQTRFVYRAVSLQDAVMFLYFAQKLLDVGKMVSWNTTIRTAYSVAWTLNVTETLSTFTVPEFIAVVQDSPPVVVNEFAHYVVGAPVQITVDGQQLATFSVTRVDNPILFLKFPMIATNGTLSFALAPQSPGICMVSIALQNQKSVEKYFYIHVLPVNDAPSFALSPKVTCLGVQPCSCSNLARPSSLNCCVEVPTNLSNILISEHITLPEFVGPENASESFWVDNFANSITVSAGYYPSSVATYAIDGYESITLLQKEHNLLPKGSEYAYTFVSSGLYVYAAEMLTDSISIFLDPTKVSAEVDSILSLITAANMSLYSIAAEDLTKEALVMEIQEFQLQIELLKSRLNVSSQMENQSLLFMDRRRGGEKRVRFVNPISFAGSQAACDLQSFTIAGNLYIVVSTGCELPGSSPEPLFDEYSMSLRFSNSDLPLQGTQLKLIQIIQDFYKTDSFSTDDLLLLTRDGCNGQNSQESCLAVRELPDSFLWNHTLGLWDFQAAAAYGTWTRPSQLKPLSCREQAASFVISPSSFLNLKSSVGSATLRGPICRENTEWDTTTAQSLNVNNFIANNGIHEAIQFDGSLNLGLTVANDITLLENANMLPSTELTIECWLTIDTSDVWFAALAAAAQSGGQYFRGWSLGYSVQNGRFLFQWSISVEKAISENAIAVECGQDVCLPGQWIHVSASYDGAQSAIYVNGMHQSSRPLCVDKSCGSIVYPQVGDGGWEGHTPLVIGAFNNVKTGTIHPHIGMIKRLRIFDVGLNSSQIFSIFQKNRDLLDSPIQLDTYWVSTTGLSLTSPSVSSMNASTLDRQQSELSILGRFDPTKAYACKFSYFDKVSISAFNSAESVRRFTCTVPDWSFGFKVTVLSLLMCNQIHGICIEPPLQTQVLWQRLCMRKDCGFPNQLNISMVHMVGTKANVEFTTSTYIYTFNGPGSGLVPRSTAALPIALPTLSVYSFNMSNKYYMLGAHDGDGLTMQGRSVLYKVELIGARLSIQTVQQLLTLTATEWTSCRVKGQSLFFVGSLLDNTQVYTWNGTQLVWKQTILGTTGSVSLNCFTIFNRTLLVLARYFDQQLFTHQLDSKVFDLSNGTISLSQSIPLNGAVHVQHFSYNETYLMFSQALGNSSKLFRLSTISNKFEIFQTILTANARKSTFFVVPGFALFLAIAQSIDCEPRSSGEYGKCSVLYRFNGTEQGYCSVQATRCVFAALTNENTLMSDVAGGQEIGTWSSMKALNGIMSDVLLLQDSQSLIIASFEAEFLEASTNQSKSSRSVLSLVYSSRKENLDGQISAPSALTVSPDKSRLFIAEQVFYAGSSGAQQVGNFSVRLTAVSIDQLSGLLVFDDSMSIEIAQGQLWGSDRCSHVCAMFFATTVNLDAHLYVATSFPGAIHMFLLDGSANRLSLLNEYTTGMEGARSLKLSADGTRLFSASYTESSLSIFARDPETGLLTFLDTIKDGEPRWDSLLNFMPLEQQHFGFSFTEKKSSTTQGIPAVCGAHFNVKGRLFWALCLENSITILKWDGERFDYYQNISEAVGARQIQHLNITNSNQAHLTEILVVICRSGNWRDSELVTWSTEVFSWDLDTESFMFLSTLLNEADYDGNIKIPSSAKPFEMYGNLYIAVAYSTNGITSNVGSVLYKWDQVGLNFLPKQIFNTFGAVDVEFKFLSKSGENNALLIFVNHVETVVVDVQCKSSPNNQGTTAIAGNGSNYSVSQESQRESCSYNYVPFFEGMQPVTSNIVQNFRTNSIVLNFDQTMDLFVQIQSIPTIGAVDVELFSIPGVLEYEIRTFLAVANKQSSYAQNASDYASYDVVSYVYEWIGFQFIPMCNFSAIQSIAEPWCNTQEALCDCQDAVQFPSVNFRGGCTTYAPGGINDGYCEVDGVCDFCPLSCADQCTDTCYIKEGDFTQILLKRKELNWNTVSGIRGATKILHFEVQGKNYLAIGQSVCNQDMNIHNCLSSGRVQPKSAILLWNSVTFEELSDDHRSYALRISAGAVVDLEYLELPSFQNESTPVRLIIFYSLTNGLQVYRWTQNIVSGLQGAVDAMEDPSSNFIYVLGEVHESVCVIQLAAVRDDLNRLVSNLTFRRTWAGLDGLGKGAYEILVLPDGKKSNITNVTVHTKQRQTELMCGPIPMQLGSAAGSFNFSSSSKCQTLGFKISPIFSKDGDVAANSMRLSSNGTFQLEEIPYVHGFAILSISASDDGIPALESQSLFFSIRIVPFSREPSFLLKNVNVSNYGFFRGPFIENIRGGAGEVVNRTLSFALTALSNPSLFQESPQLEINGQTGYISFSSVPYAVGTSEVTVLLTDDIGNNNVTLRSCLLGTSNLQSKNYSASEICLCQAVNVQSEKATSSISFFVEITGPSPNATFELIKNYTIIAEASLYTIENFAQNISTGTDSINQEYTFILSEIAGSGRSFDYRQFFSSGLPILHENGTLQFTISRSAVLLFRSVFPEILPSVPVTSGDGILLLTFTLEIGGHFARRTNKSSVFSQSCIVSIIYMNYRPSFTLLQDVINIESSDTSVVFANVSFASDISSSSFGGEQTEGLTFIIDSVSNPSLFETTPKATIQGNIIFTLAPGAMGISLVNIKLVESSKLTFNGLGSNSSIVNSVIINVTRPILFPAYRILQEVYLAELSAQNSIKNFVTNISGGNFNHGLKSRRIFFELTIITMEPWNLLSDLPTIDENGTLDFFTVPGLNGSATLSLTSYILNSVGHSVYEVRFLQNC